MSLLRLEHAVEECVVAIACIRQFLHHRVLVVAVSDAQDGEKHARFALRRDVALQLGGVVDADVEVAVRHQHHAVVLFLVEVLHRLLVGELEALAARRAAARAQLVQHAANLRLVRARSRGQLHLHAARVGDDRDGILRAQLVRQEPQRLQKRREAAVVGHRSGLVDQEHEVARRDGLLGDALRLHGHAQELVRRVPRAGAQFARHRYRHVTRRPRVVVGEIVHVFLNANGVLWRQALRLRQVPAHCRVARRIDIQAEGGERVRLHLAEIVLLELGEPFASDCICGRRSRLRKRHTGRGKVSHATYRPARG